MHDYSEIIISPMELGKNKVLSKYMTLPRPSSIVIKGVVFDNLCQVCAQVILEIIKIDRRYGVPKRIQEGYVITNEQGEYVIRVEQNPWIDYEFKVYKPPLKG